jgi:ribosomal protein S18 acetylase RimI-like enzyme
MINAFVREAEESDLPAIEKLTAELLNSLENLKDIEMQQALDNCRVLLHDPHFYFFVAELNQTVVGFVNFTLRKTLLHRGFSGVITELIVTKDYQGKGIGKQLIFTTIKHCKQLGCCEVEVSTEKTNTNAQDLYLRCGFEERGLLFEVEL